VASKNQEAVFEATQANLRFYALLGAIVGLGLIILSVALGALWEPEEANAWRDLVVVTTASVGAAVLPIGIALIITDVILKPVFTRELLNLAQLEKRVSDIGFQDLTPSGSVPWAELYASSSLIDAVITHPEAWLHENLDRILECGRRKTSVRLYLADPLSVASARMADDMNIPVASYKAQILRLPEQIRDRWKSAVGLHPGASIEIWYLRDPVSGPLFRFDKSTVVGLTSGPVQGLRSWMYMQFERSALTDVGEWLDRSWRDVEQSVSLPEAWTSKATDRTPEGTRERLESVLRDREEKQ